jgi:RHS repeat-associated protein
MAFAEVTKRFVYSTRYIDEPFLYTVNGTKYYVHQNHLFSVAAVTDAAGATRERYSYTSYGDRIVCAPTGAPLTNSQVNNEIGFTGYVCYPETSVNFARERVYGCAIGRFLSRDPLGYFDGVSLYGAYFIPNQLDPTGTKTEDHHWFAQKFSLLFQDICQIPIHEFTTTLDLEAHHYAHDILKDNQMLIRKLRKCIGAKVDCCCVVKTVQQHSKETAVNLSLRGHVPWGVQEAAGNRNSPSLGLPLHPYRNPNKNTESQWNRMQDICRENNCEKDVPRQIDLEGVMNEWYTNNPMHEVDPFSALYNNPGRYGISIPTVGLPARSGGRIPNVSPKSYPKIKTKKKECCPLQPDESIPYDQPRKTG